jgi:integrase
MGEFIAEWLKSSAGQTVGREFSAYNGLWRWAMRRGYADINPWSDQMAGRKDRTADKAPERGSSTAELVMLLRGGVADLAPPRGALAPTFWDGTRLAMLTGARAGELFGLRVGDVNEGGSAVVFAGGRGDGKTRVTAQVLGP